MKKKKWYIVFLVFMISHYTHAAKQTEAEEYNLKATFLYNFANFIEWENVLTDESFIIGIIGPSSIKAPLEEIARTKTINNKKIIIREFSRPEDVTFCNILFISEKSLYELNAILEKVPRNTLTVTEKKDYALEGACINFVIVKNKLKFETNLNAIQSAGLKASAQLLKLAIIVN